MGRALVLGAGFGGLTAAQGLRRRLPPEHEVVLVDRRAEFQMGLANLWVLDGRRGAAQGRRPLERAARDGIIVRRGEVQRIDPARRTVQVGGEEIAYDVLVLALGADTAGAAATLPGFEAAHDLYDVAGAAAAHDALVGLQKGRVLLFVSSMPFRCPPAPYEAAILVEALLRQRGVRDNARITLTTPEPHPLPIAQRQHGQRLVDLLRDRRIEYIPNAKPERIRADRRLVEYEDGAARSFDVLLGVPPHRAPPVVAEAGLTDGSGFVPVDAGTLRTQDPRVFAVGDVATLKIPNGRPLPKAGVLAEAQAQVAAAHAAAALLDAAAPAERFDGKGTCHMELGGGAAMEVQGEFFAPEPRFTFAAPGPQALHAKERFEAERLERWFGR